MLSKLKSKLAEWKRFGADPKETAWSKEYAEEQVWTSVRNPELSATRKQRLNQLWLLGVLAALPIAAGAAVLSMMTHGDAQNARAIAEDAEAIARVPIPVAIYDTEAEAELRKRLAYTFHPILKSDAFYLHHEGFQTGLGDIETHRFSIINFKGIVAYAHVSIIEDPGSIGVGRLLGVFFTTPPLESDVLFSDSYDVDDILQLEELEEGAFAAAFAAQPTINDAWQEQARTYGGEFDVKIEEWLSAFMIDDQPTLRELARQGESDVLLPVFPWEGWQVKESEVRGAWAIGETTHILQIQLLLADPNGAELVTDMELLLQTEGELVNVLASGPLGRQS